MPNIKSAITRVANSQRKTAYNKKAKSQMRTAVKKAEQAIDAAAENAEELVQKSQVMLDKAVSKGLIHKNTAARKKARLAKRLNATK